jgi:hypothetical protein
VQSKDKSFCKKTTLFFVHFNLSIFFTFLFCSTDIMATLHPNIDIYLLISFAFLLPLPSLSPPLFLFFYPLYLFRFSFSSDLFINPLLSPFFLVRTTATLGIRFLKVGSTGLERLKATKGNLSDCFKRGKTRGKRGENE